MFVDDSALEGMNPKRDGGMKNGQIEGVTDKWLKVVSQERFSMSFSM